MIANINLVGEYSDSYDFVKNFVGEENFNKICKILNIEFKEVEDYMKKHNEEDMFMALFDLQVQEYAICDKDVLTSYLAKEKGNFFVEYEDENNGYFKVYEVMG